MRILIALFLLAPYFSYSEDISKEYNDISENFIKAFIEDSPEASRLALKQLDIDPSDSTALLRLSISILPNQCKDIKSYYFHLGSQDEINKIAQAIILKKCKFDVN